MSEFRALGTPITFDTATDVGLTVTFTGTGSATINAATLAFLQLPAGSSWRLPDLLQELTKKISDWIVAAVAIGGDPAGTAAPLVALNFIPSLNSNGSLCSLAFSVTGTTVGGGAATVTAATLVNTNGLWSKLGLCLESATSRSASVATGTATFSGLFQPRSMFCLLRSEIDLGNSTEILQYKALKRNDGSGSVFYSGRLLDRRSLRLVDLDENVAGRDVVIAQLDSLNADRVNIETNHSTELNYNTNITGAKYQDDLADVLLADGAFVSLGNAWIGRVQSIDSGSEPQTITLFEKVPSSVTPPTTCKIVRISDLHALWFEALRTGYLCVFDAVETPGVTFGNVRWLSQTYMLAEESKKWFADRRDIGAPLYSYTFELIRVEADGFSSAS